MTQITQRVPLPMISTMAYSADSGSHVQRKYPGQICCLQYCSKSCQDGVSLFSIPKEETLKRRWMNFITAKRDKSSMAHKKGWFYVCSDHFADEDLEGYGQFKAELRKKLGLRKGAVPCKYPTPTAEQLEKERKAYEREKQRGKQPKTTSLPSTSTVVDGGQVSGKRKRREKVIQKLVARRVCTRVYLILHQAWDQRAHMC